jgi:hypothetical protein
MRGTVYIAPFSLCYYEPSFKYRINSTLAADATPPLGLVAPLFELQEALQVKRAFSVKPAETASEGHKRVFSGCS